MPVASNTPPPSVAELAYLEQAVRANPKGHEFVTLGAAYLRLGRPADAIRALARGLTHSPGTVAARILIGRAYLISRDLDGAQSHLVKAVKSDPSSFEGFTLLGQTLLERGDRARAVQMLERALALAPRNAEVAALLARARPRPEQPANEPDEPDEPDDSDQIETLDSAVELLPPTPPPATSPPAPPPAVIAAGDSAPLEERLEARPASPGAPRRERPLERPRQAAAPNKRANLGGEAKLRSAALGDEFLPRLLAGGLLAVPNVTARDRVGAAAAQRQQMWRTLLRRALVLTIIAGVAVGGFLAYTYVARKQRAADMTDTLAKAGALMASGKQADLLAAAKIFKDGLVKLPADAALTAGLASTLALEHLWFGATDAASVEAAVTDAERVAQGSGGAKELAVARVARDLASADAAPAAGLDAAVQAALHQWSQDDTVQMLAAERAVQLGHGEEARRLFTSVDAGGKGPALAAVRLGDLALDDGDVQGAEERYESALTRAPGHTLALVGRSLARVERGGDPEAAMQDLNVDLASAEGTRVEGYRHLALALVWVQLEDFDKYQSELDLAVDSGIKDVRFLVRVALARLDRGELAAAMKVLESIVDPRGEALAATGITRLARAELSLSQGKPVEALGLGGKMDTLRAHKLRGRALIDLGRDEEAVGELEAALALDKEDPTAGAYAELGRMKVAMAKGDAAGAETAYQRLAKLARASVSGLPRYVLGEANLARGKPADARRDFEASLEGDNPLAYRARSRLVALYLDDNQVAPAADAVKAALAQAPQYRPALVGQGRVLLAEGKTGAGLRILTAQLADGSGSAADELALAGALASTGQLEAGRAALQRARQKGARSELIAPIEAQLVSPGPMP
jgi:tetratricopeptide (TPR) repeat protein